MIVAGVQHVAIDVDDLAAAEQFYVQALGLVIAPRPEALGAGGLWLDVPGGGQIHLAESGNFVAPQTSQHVAFAVTDVDACVTDLRGAGLEISDSFDLGAGKQAFLRDPAGNLIELNQPT